MKKNAWESGAMSHQPSAFNSTGASPSKEEWIFNAAQKLMVLISLAGFFYQSYLFLELFLQYSVTIEISVENNWKSTFPAVTICNGNRARASAWCQFNSSICVKLNGSAIPNSENVTTTQAPPRWGRGRRRDKHSSKELMRDYNQLKRETKVKLGHTKEDFIISCTYAGQNCTDMISQFYDFRYTNCFTVNANWTTSSRMLPPAPRWNKTTADITELVMVLNLEEREYTAMDLPVTTRVTIHSPLNKPRPDENGVDITPGTSTRIGIDMLKRILLPPPYTTNCKNYKTRDKTTGALWTSGNCNNACYLRKSLEQCGCTFVRLADIHDKRGCDYSNKKQVDCLNDVYEREQEFCAKECPEACEIEVYTFSILDEVPWPTDLEEVPPQFVKLDIENLRNNLLELKFQYNSAKYTVHRYSPKYQRIEAFSFLGGYLGLWLGISFVSLLDYIRRAVIATKKNIVIAKQKIRNRKKVKDKSNTMFIGQRRVRLHSRLGTARAISRQSMLGTIKPTPSQLYDGFNRSTNWVGFPTLNIQNTDKRYAKIDFTSASPTLSMSSGGFQSSPQQHRHRNNARISW